MNTIDGKERQGILDAIGVQRQSWNPQSGRVEAELTEEEYAMIVAHRKAKSASDMVQAMKLLDLVSRWTKYIEYTGDGSSYSAFVNDFGYNGIEGEDRPETYRKVCEIINRAKDLVAGH